jgi:hypothetical protein
MYRLRSPLPCIAIATFSLLLGAAARAQTDLIIYDDALQNGWGDWGWTNSNYANVAPVHSGSNSIAITPGPWEGAQMGHNYPAPFDSTGYGNLTFWINGGATGGQVLQVYATLNYTGQPAVSIGSIAANTWQKITIPLASLGVADQTTVTSFVIQNTGTAAATFYVDDIVVTGSVPTIPPPPLNGGMAVYVDSLVNGWQNWSWNTTVGVETTIVNSGSSSMAVTLAGGGLSLHHDDFSTTDFPTLTFWINGGPVGGQLLAVNIERDDGVRPAVALDPLPANTWQKISIPLAALGAGNIPDLNRITFREASGGSAATFYLDDVRLDLAPPPSVVQVSVRNNQVIRTVDPRTFGLNTAIWDGTFNTATTAELLNEVDNQALRYPGGSISDIYHWATNTSEGQNFQWATNFDAFANIAKATQAQVFITANYGTGTPEEAAAWVKYSNVTKNYGFKYWEIGNENYGTWEADNNTRPNDPVTYATRFKEYVRQMKAVDSSIKIGAVILANEDEQAHYPDETAINPRTGVAHHGWSAVVLATMKTLGVTPDFVVYHRYEQGPGGENDWYLLNSSRTWGRDAGNLRQILNDYLGKSANKIEITCTENNSVYGNPGKQTTSLVNGLFMADSLGNLMKTEFNSFFWWDLRNGQETGNNNSPLLYGWRNYGDYGIITYANPAGPADRYPTFYIYKLLQHFARGGEKVVTTSSDYDLLGVYAVRDPVAHTLNLLVINKHPTATLNVNISIAGYSLGQPVDVYSYGIPQDEAARTGTGSADVAHRTTALSGKSFTFTPEPYSATVLRIPESTTP